MRDRVQDIVVASYSRALAEAGSESAALPSISTPLFGSDAELDSMGLVALVLDVEEQLGDQLGIDITLMDEKALSRRRSPFRTIESLTEYVLELADPEPAPVS